MRQVRRCKDDRALLEGPHLVTEALAAGLSLDPLLATPDLLDRPEGRELLERLAARSAATPGELEEVDADALASVMDADSPRGVAAVTHLPRPDVTALPRRTGGVYVFAEGLQDPGNLGALARSAEAAGAAALVLSPGCAHPNHPRALRASAGSLLRLPVAVGVEAEALERHLADQGPTWVALATRGGLGLWATTEGDGGALDGTVILALGGEGSGLSEELEARAGLRITIPLQDPVESLNATVAASLVLFELRRRRRGGAAG